MVVSIMQWMTRYSPKVFQYIQKVLNFDTIYYSKNSQYATKYGLGRTAYIGTVLGIILGIHSMLWIQLVVYNCMSHTYVSQQQQQQNDQVHNTDNNNNQRTISFMILQWCTYIIGLCIFHLLEFFITSLYNPTQCTSDSYLINHSLSYTTAAILSWCEFGIRLLFLRSYTYCHLPYTISYIGIVLLVIAQYIRSSAMITAGESFNHMIQTSKKENHILITNGIYRIFRHPSYVGFFYWSIATQCILGNVIHTILYTIVSWTFFYRRIQYEEESLLQFFPTSYPSYIQQTYMGIPFIQSDTTTIVTTTPATIDARNDKNE